MEGEVRSIVIGRSGNLAEMAVSGATPKRRDANALRGALRRRFTAAYKLQVLQQADKAVAEGNGRLADLLAREGLYSSHLAQWRKQRKEGSLRKARRGRIPLSRKTLLAENGRLRRKLASIEKGLRTAVQAVPLAQRTAPAVLANAAWLLRQRVLAALREMEGCAKA
jgi:hypothetical protein